MSPLKFKKFTYSNSLKWEKEKRATVSCPGKQDISLVTPPEFGGEPGIWTPEDLFVVSINSCIMMTFLYFVERKKIRVLSYESEAEGIVEMVNGSLKFTKVRISPRIKVSMADDIEKVRSLINRCEKACLVSNSVNAGIEIIPCIEHASI